MSDVIVAHATPQGSGALAIVRLSGFLVREMVEKVVILKSKKKICEVPSHTVHYADFVSSSGQLVDQVIVMIMDGPRSFTGENTIEITCHNNQYIVSKILDCLVLQGCRMALRGEFAERAVMNQKIDVMQAEAINDLIHAQSESATKIALQQVSGSLSYEINAIDEGLVEVAAWCQASFEFLEEERDFREIILSKVVSLKERIKKLIDTNSIYKMVKEGVRIAIIGNVNVGKSSLLNCLLGYNRAIVNAIAGTTRDTVEANISFGDYHATLIDTAGIRLTNDDIEKEGVEKSYREFALADLVILVYTEEMVKNRLLSEWYLSLYEKKKEKIILVRNKIDIGSDLYFYPHDISISTKEKKNISILHDAIIEYIKKQYFFSSFSYIVNNRQVGVLKDVFNKLDIIITLLKVVNPFYELVLYHLNEVQIILSEMGAKAVEERSFDKVFREFCVGK
jgi:tRNA modification GTPase